MPAPLPNKLTKSLYWGNCGCSDIVLGRIQVMVGTHYCDQFKGLDGDSYCKIW
ncbi:hypothetical protein DOT_3320 [Desulfosporosinus sp. OT]|nr:hypothetical protein DOT_3320 [Desulfosporosinus sp. OT]